MGILLMVCVIDDLIDMSASAKLSAQVLVAVLMVSWSAVQIHSLGDPVGVKPIGMNEWAIPFTVLCTSLLINAINMADGTDGLAGGMVAVALAIDGGRYPGRRVARVRRRDRRITGIIGRYSLLQPQGAGPEMRLGVHRRFRQ